MNEADFIAILCALVLGGEPEVSHSYNVGYNLHRIRVDCETDTQVIEVGLDKRSSLDSVQQALFASALTGKEPVVALIDTDGREGNYEYRIRTSAELAGVEFVRYSANFLVRWHMTAYLRSLSDGGPNSPEAIWLFKQRTSPSARQRP